MLKEKNKYHVLIMNKINTLVLEKKPKIKDLKILRKDLMKLGMTINYIQMEDKSK